jgi:hypothetical protein
MGTFGRSIIELFSSKVEGEPADRGLIEMVIPPPAGVGLRI